MLSRFPVGLWGRGGPLMAPAGPRARPQTSPDKETLLSVKIRMKRFGRTNRPFYRINAVDTRASRDGRVIEELGSYDPHGSEGQKVRLNAERAAYWLSVGAQPSETVRTFLKKAGLIKPKPKAAKKKKAAQA